MIDICLCNSAADSVVVDKIVVVVFVGNDGVVDLLLGFAKKIQIMILLHF